MHPDPESVSIQLTRMEGVLNNVSEKVSSVIVRVDRHEDSIRRLQSATQQLKSDAVASELTKIATAKALAEAAAAAAAVAAAEVAKTDAAYAAARAEQLAGEQRWTPRSRFYAALLSLTSAGAALITIYKLTGH